MKTLVGLGNPEGRYAANRHNIGFLILDRIASEAGAAVRERARHSRFCRTLLWNCDTLLVKPQTYMNRSGLALREMHERWALEPESVLVVYDDFALPLGRIRLRPGGSAAGHHGMESILEAMGTDQIPRLRFGIGTPAGAKAADFVLSDFDAAEGPVVESAIDRSVEAIRTVWTAGMAQAMSLFNRDPTAEEP